jgi:hypothetical protein
MEPSFFDHREPAADHAGEGEHLRPFEGLEADGGEQDKSFPLEISKERDL